MLVGKEFPLAHLKVANYIDERIEIIEEARKQGKKILLFWYPKDFTFVCPTELHAFQAALPELEARNTMVFGASCDSVEVHHLLYLFSRSFQFQYFHLRELKQHHLQI